MYFGFENKKDMVREFNIDSTILENVTILGAYYGHGCYEGDAHVIFLKDEKLYEVYGSHCSCYGLEDQWYEEESSWEFLEHKFKDHYACDGDLYNSFVNHVKDFIAGMLLERDILRN